ncbi:hypothetical protein Ancab_030134 [Ancistrocladus abbreviatus]
MRRWLRILKAQHRGSLITSITSTYRAPTTKITQMTSWGVVWNSSKTNRDTTKVPKFSISLPDYCDKKVQFVGYDDNESEKCSTGPVPNEPKETTVSSEHNSYGGSPSMRSVKGKSKYDSKDSSATSRTSNTSANINEDHDKNINEGSSLYPGCHDKIHISSTKENRGLPVHGPPTSKAYQKNIVIHKGTNMHSPTNE